jgi:hypothetical protein
MSRTMKTERNEVVGWDKVAKEPCVVHACKRRSLAAVSCLVLNVAAACVMIMTLTGCGKNSTDKTAHWSGEITLGGKPLPDDAEGSITFRPLSPKGGQAVTVRIENGSYDSPLTPKGKIIAYFDINQPTGRTFHSDRVGKDVPETKSIVPAGPAQGMEFNVTGDKSDANIGL